MSYDLEITSAQLPPKAPMVAPLVHGTDLEAIVMLLELAAISLTSTPEDVFTAEELLAEAQDIGGDEIVLDETDVQIVLDKASFLKKERRQYRLK